MKIILTGHPSTSTLILWFLAPVVLTCFALPAAFAACMDNPETRSAIARISHLTEAPETIQDLARAIQGNNAAQIRESFIHRYGPIRHVGSGLDIEQWDVQEGGLVLHPWVGPTFTPTGRNTICLLATT